MPLLYGERQRAFIRLQEEIMKVSDDELLFAWKETTSKTHSTYRGLLATSPAEFASSRNIIPFYQPGESTPYSMTNKGLQLQLRLREWSGDSLYLAALNCRETSDSLVRQQLGIYLHNPNPLFHDQLVRIHSNHLSIIPSTPHDTTINNTVFVRQVDLSPETVHTGLYRFYFKRFLSPASEFSFYISDAYPKDNWNLKKSMLKFPTTQGGVSGALEFKSHAHSHPPAKSVILLLGVEVDLSPWCAIILGGPGTLKEVFEGHSWSSNLPLLNAFGFEFKLGSHSYDSSVVIETMHSEPNAFLVYFTIDRAEASVIE